MPNKLKHPSATSVQWKNAKNAKKDSFWRKTKLVSYTAHPVKKKCRTVTNVLLKASVTFVMQEWRKWIEILNALIARTDGL